jgi:hypothetical protein
MQPVTPVLPGFDFAELAIAKDQEEYMTLPAVVVDNGSALLTRWEPTEDDRRRIAEGQSVYVFIGVSPQEERISIRPILLEVATAQELVERGEQNLAQPTSVSRLLA